MKPPMTPRGAKEILAVLRLGERENAKPVFVTNASENPDGTSLCPLFLGETLQDW